MFETNRKNFLDVEVDGTNADSTMSVFPGMIQLGTSVLPFSGDQTTIRGLSGFTGSATTLYQYSLVYLQNVGGVVDMTTARTADATGLRFAEYPTLPDSTSRAVGLFTLKRSDGTVSLESFSKVF